MDRFRYWWILYILFIGSFKFILELEILLVLVLMLVFFLRVINFFRFNLCVGLVLLIWWFIFFSDLFFLFVMVFVEYLMVGFDVLVFLLWWEFLLYCLLIRLFLLLFFGLVLFLLFWFLFVKFFFFKLL